MLLILLKELLFDDRIRYGVRDPTELPRGWVVLEKTTTSIRPTAGSLFHEPEDFHNHFALRLLLVSLLARACFVAPPALVILLLLLLLLQRGVAGCRRFILSVGLACSQPSVEIESTNNL